MKMFMLEKQTAVLQHINPRTEKHGDANVPALDMKIIATMPNVVMDQFHHLMRASFYRKMGKAEAEAASAGDGPDLADRASAPEDGLIKLKMPHGPLYPWNEEFSGYTGTIAYGIGGSDIPLTDGHLSRFKFDMKDGGSVIISFTISCKPSEEQVGKLYGLLGKDITIDLTPPEETPAT
jgi:hypothetical protein